MTLSRILRAWMALAVVVTAAGTLRASSSAAQTVSTALPSRQILVMLKVPPQHFRPGSAYAGGYGDTASQAMRRRMAQSIARKNGFTLVDGWPMPLLGVDCYVMRIADGQSIEAAVASAFRAILNVAWSEPMQLYQAMAASSPDDPLYPIEPAAKGWRLADLHKVATGRGVSVAVIDSKVEVTHPDLAGQLHRRQGLPGRQYAGSRTARHRGRRDHRRQGRQRDRH